MGVVDELMEGALDIHTHIGPDPRVDRRADAVEVARYARRLGMRGLVLKSHEYPTAPLASTVARVVEGIEVYGGVCLDNEVGGLNPHAVWASGRMGARILWMPTFSARADTVHGRRGAPLDLLDEGGRLRPEVEECLDLAREFGMAVATGHISPREALAVVSACRERGIPAVVTHASSSAVWLGLTLDHQKALADRGAFLEHCVHALMPLTLRLPVEEMVAQIRAVGAERCILSTDFGQDFHPIPPEGLRMGIAHLLRAGLTAEELDRMVRRNPARLLGLE